MKVKKDSVSVISNQTKEKNNKNKKEDIIIYAFDKEQLEKYKDDGYIPIEAIDLFLKERNKEIQFDNIEQLKEKVLDLYFKQNYSYREIALKLDISRQTVSDIVHDKASCKHIVKRINL